MSKVGWYEDETVDAIDVDTDAIIADLATVEGKVDTVDTVVDAIKVDTDKIDDATTLGLLGTNNSLAYRIAEVERHFHSYERWYELAASPSAETHRADPAGTGAGIFQIDAGNNNWGNWLQILGSSDTALKYDLHRVLVTATERNAIYVMQIGFGASGAAALTDGTYTEVPFIPASNVVDNGPVEVQSRRQLAGTKAWARCRCPGQDTGTINFMFGLHYYEG